MKKSGWFGARGLIGSGDPFLASLFRLLARESSEKSALPSVHAARAKDLALPDPGADASWTASLCRGDDLPPCRLSIAIAAGACSAMRLESFGRDATSAPRVLDL
ncbi:hypothetical protein [Rhodoblastus sp.]|uniref:hypothetical protein n=1 Tax=Rhodoblastus sp. TaxID=1962975 RepID=UPI0035B456F8